MKHQTKKILMFGAQGSGKGTQAELISRSCGYVYISTGDIFRREIKNKTKLGKQALAYINAGKLVPDKITNQMVKNHLNKPQARKKGVVLDGYPRTLLQKRALDKITEITDAVVINITDHEAIFRLGGRLACKCGLSYHIRFNPPKKKGVCDRCGEKLFVRDDDTPAAIKQRLITYHRETEVIFASYRKHGILHIINGMQSIKEVTADIIKALDLKSCKL